MLDAFASLLCSKLCQHNWRKPNLDCKRLMASPVLSYVTHKVIHKLTLLNCEIPYKQKFWRAEYLAFA